MATKIKGGVRIVEAFMRNASGIDVPVRLRNKHPEIVGEAQAELKRFYTIEGRMPACLVLGYEFVEFFTAAVWELQPKSKGKHISSIGLGGMQIPIVVVPGRCLYAGDSPIPALAQVVAEQDIVEGAPGDEPN